MKLTKKQVLAALVLQNYGVEGGSQIWLADGEGDTPLKGAWRLAIREGIAKPDFDKSGTVSTFRLEEDIMIRLSEWIQATPNAAAIASNAYGYFEIKEWLDEA